MTEQHKRVGAYGRASHLNEFSVDRQLDEIDKWIEREGWQSVFRLRDDGISASKYHKGRKREDWPQVMERIQAGAIDVLLLWEVSRASRDRQVFAALFAACESSNIKLGVQGKIYDLHDPDDAFQLDLMASLAVRESGVTSKRLRRDTRARALTGHPHGKIRYGYRRVYDDNTGKLLRQEIDETAATIVREIIRRALSGEAMAAIARDLTDRGVATPTETRHQRLGTEPPKQYAWDQAQIRRICLDPEYAGMRSHKGEVVGDAAWPAIVSQEDHAVLTARLTDPTRVSTDDWTPKHLLVGLARCGYPFEHGPCDATMRRVKNRGNYSYDCSAYHHTARIQWRVDELARKVMIARFQRDDIAELLAHDDSDQTDALGELRELEARLDAHTAEAAEGRLTAQRLAKLEAMLEPKIDAARRRSQPRDLPDEVRALVDADDPETVWDGFELHQKRRVIRAVVTVRITPRGKGRWTGVDTGVRFEWHHSD